MSELLSATTALLDEADQCRARAEREAKKADRIKRCLSDFKGKATAFWTLDNQVTLVEGKDYIIRFGNGTYYSDVRVRRYAGAVGWEEYTRNFVDDWNRSDNDNSCVEVLVSGDQT